MKRWFPTARPDKVLLSGWFSFGARAQSGGAGYGALGIFAKRELFYGENFWQLFGLPFRVFFSGQDDHPQLFDGVLTPTQKWPRLDRFKEHDIELPVAELDVRPAAGQELAAGLAQAVKLGRNMVRVLPTLGSPRRGTPNTRSASPRFQRPSRSASMRIGEMSAIGVTPA